MNDSTRVSATMFTNSVVKACAAGFTLARFYDRENKRGIV